MVWPVQRSNTLTLYWLLTDFWTAVKEKATSILQELRVHAVAVSGEPPGMLHGFSGVQTCKDLMGSALAGAYEGTVCGLWLPVGDGDVRGVAPGLVEACADADGVVCT